MVQALTASSLSLNEVMERLQFEGAFSESFEEFLTLEPLTSVEKAGAADLQRVWQEYRFQSRTAENYVKTAGLPLLLWLCGYIAAGLQLLLEENIEPIEIDDGETVIRGRMDMLLYRQPKGDRTALCALVIETKRGAASGLAGLPQLLTYASTFLDKQPVVWGLITNGYEYEFVRIERGLFREFSPLSVLYPKDLELLVQVAIAIRKLATVE